MDQRPLLDDSDLNQLESTLKGSYLRLRTTLSFLTPSDLQIWLMSVVVVGQSSKWTLLVLLEPVGSE